MSDNANQTTALYVILHNPTLLPKLLKAWQKAGIPGVTIVPSIGGFEAEKHVRKGGFSGLLNLITQDGSSGQQTLMSVIDDREMLELAISEADRVVKGFDSPNSGILFTLPIGQVLGLNKWGEKDPDEIDQAPDQEKTNLLQWFQEDVLNTFGKEALIDWSAQREIQVSEIVTHLSLEPIIVNVDSPIPEVLAKLLHAPKVATACVINSENRLMGTIHTSALAEVMMAPVVPEAFIDDPDGYNKALQYTGSDQYRYAADVMRDPVYAMLSDNLSVVYQRMSKEQISGMPVVDQYYRIQGYITLLEIIAACFPDQMTGIKNTEHKKKTK
ncbi:MAG: CBS domain-containing protein [Chloroflexota bacterium]